MIAKTIDQSMAPAIEMVDLCKTFGDLRAVDHLTLAVKRGEIFGLLGPNGAGKTTAMDMLSGLSVPTSGEARVMGYDVRHHARTVRQLLGAVPQETALYEELSAWANMNFHAELFGVPQKEKQQRITAMLQLVQLLDRKDSPVRTFSDGMKRRLALARALLHDPQLIYLDEPTLGVDVQSRRAIWDYTLALRDQGKMVLITTNYLEEAQALCERLAIIDHGKLVAVDTPEQLKQTYGGSVIELELVGLLSVVAALALVILVIGVWPAHWGEVIAFTLLTMVIFIAWGILLSALIKQYRAFTLLAFSSVLPLFVLSGSFGPISFFNIPIVQVLAQLFPTYYAIVLEQHAFHGFDLNTYAIGLNVAILCAYTVLLVVLATLVFRRQTVAK
jgi:ABC-2 type transport system ATP-binding protein